MNTATSLVHHVRITNAKVYEFFFSYSSYSTLNQIQLFPSQFPLQFIIIDLKFVSAKDDDSDSENDEHNKVSRHRNERREREHENGSKHSRESSRNRHRQHKDTKSSRTSNSYARNYDVYCVAVNTTMVTANPIEPHLRSTGVSSSSLHEGTRTLNNGLIYVKF